MPKVTLRYWDCQGRGEFIRLMLRDCGLEFEEELLKHEDLSSWPERKRMVNFGGAYGQLPVLHWQDDEDSDEVLVSQTLSIGMFLNKKLCPAQMNNPEAEAKAMSLACFVYEELHVPLLKQMWGVGAQPAQFFGEQVPRRLERLDARVPEDGFMLGDAPCWAEYLLFATLESLSQVLGEGVMSGFGYLNEFAGRMKARHGISLWTMEPRRPISLCRSEDANIKRIRIECLTAPSTPLNDVK
uniref:Glutathione S-transferase n=1 Tax=Tetraselmis sp. GSL018 TaxID=582737 RepID=A0A061R4H4_9CHLO